MNFHTHKWIGALWLCMALALSASAAKLVTSVVRVDLSKDKPTALMTVSNKGDSKTILQIDPVSWHQSKGVDVYEPTEDVLAVPTLFVLKPGESQVIRIGMRKNPDSDKERAYRLFLNELPDAAAAVPDSVRVMLRIGIPLFVHSAVREAHDLQWSAICQHGGKLHLGASNSGNAHIKILDISIKSKESGKSLARSDLADYLLAGTNRSWDIGVSGCPEAGKMLELSVGTDSGAVNAHIPLKE